VDLSRRTLLKAGGLTAAVSTLGAAPAHAQARPVRTVTLSGVAFGAGRYLYHPFEVPGGVRRVDVRIAKQGSAATGLGLFDARGSHYATLERPNGFRGIYGEERGEFFVAADAASQAFLPGPMDPGEWTVVVPVFQAPTPTPYTVTVQMTSGRPGRPFVLGADLDTVLGEPGWYRGDLHAHTPESSDAWSSGTALGPREWAEVCRGIGLDFLALTDHNVVSQNLAIADAAGEDVLLMAGEEMTNWFHGHATVSGMAPGEWFDWRQLPAAALTPEALADPRTGTIQEFLRAARASGAFVSAAHPFGASLAWRFFPDAAVDPAARTDSVEVWTGAFQPDDQASVNAWDDMNRQGQHLVANGGSDLHGVENTMGFAAGTPTTVVHAPALSKRAVVDALRRGRSFITRTPSGVEAYLSASLRGQRQIMGGTVYGDPTDVVDVEVVVRRAVGMRLVLLRDGAPVGVTRLATDDETVTARVPVGAGGLVRAEVRGESELFPDRPLAGRMDMEALTNPVWLEVGEPPPGTAPDPTLPPEHVGPRRGGTTTSVPAAASAPAGLPAPGPSRPQLARGLPATGSAVALPVVATAVAAAAAAVGRRSAPTVEEDGPVPLTHAEYLLRRASGTLPPQVVLTGRVTAVGPGPGAGTVRLSRWVPGCCSRDTELAVEVTAVAAVEGEWLQVTAEPAGDGVRAVRTVVLAEPPPAREG
jgi:hypothetical protein